MVVGKVMGGGSAGAGAAPASGGAAEAALPCAERPRFLRAAGLASPAAGSAVRQLPQRVGQRHLAQ